MASVSTHWFLKSELYAKSRLFKVKFHFGHKILYLKSRLYVKSRSVKSRLYCILLTRTQRQVDGPMLPEPLNKPCLVELPEFSVIFIMGSALLRNATHTSSFLYHLVKDKWINITQNHLYDRVSHNKYSCSILQRDTIIISTLHIDGTVRTWQFNISSSAWTHINSGIKEKNISDIHLLRSKEMHFVTMLASSITTSSTFIYQVSMKLQSKILLSKCESENRLEMWMKVG